MVVIPFKGATEIKQYIIFKGINYVVTRCASPSEIPKPRERERERERFASEEEEHMTEKSEKGRQGKKNKKKKVMDSVV